MKFGIGKTTLQPFGIELEQMVIDIDEIQGEDEDLIIRAKAAAAFEAVGQPVIVTDDSWSIAGLKGFPGAYMKSVNHWFSPDDFIRLTKDLENRLITLEQWLAYQDEHECVVFRKDQTGKLLTESRGLTGPSILQVITMDCDNGESVSEIYDSGLEHENNRMKDNNAWEVFGGWYKANRE